MLSVEEAANAPNMPEMEQQWAVLAYHQAETYFNLISTTNTVELQLTLLDDAIFLHYSTEFPDIDLACFNELKDFKSPDMKIKWRNFIEKYEKSVEDFNFGTLLRIDCSKDYDQDNSIFVTRLQFYAIEIARNRAGLNAALNRTNQVSV